MAEPRYKQRAHYSDSGETWLEHEDFCSTVKSRNRRAKVLMPDGRHKIIKCGIPDTFFSIPVRPSDGDGFITIEDGEFVFVQHDREAGDV